MHQPENCDRLGRFVGYEPVSTPQPGDIVVYWGDAGEPAHSGIVRAVGSEGLVVIESKWGRLGRYLHLTAISHFPSRFTYHRRRTDRSLPVDGIAHATAIVKPGAHGAD